MLWSSELKATPIDSYQPNAPFLDELFEPDGSPRPTARALRGGAGATGTRGPDRGGRRRDAIFMQQGITFETSSGGGATHERPFPLDLVPRVLSGVEWRAIKRGLAQRIPALNHFVDDVSITPVRSSGRGSCRGAWSAPARIFRVPSMDRPPGGVYTHVAGCDLSATATGRGRSSRTTCAFRRGYSSYCSRTGLRWHGSCPELFASYRVRPVDHYPQLLLRALRRWPRSAESEATVVE